MCYSRFLVRHNILVMCIKQQTLGFVGCSREAALLLLFHGEGASLAPGLLPGSQPACSCLLPRTRSGQRLLPTSPANLGEYPGTSSTVSLSCRALGSGDMLRMHCWVAAALRVPLAMAEGQKWGVQRLIQFIQQPLRASGLSCILGLLCPLCLGESNAISMFTPPKLNLQSKSLPTLQGLYIWLPLCVSNSIQDRWGHLYNEERQPLGQVF